MRLDLALSEKYNLTRNKAQAFIKDGLVSVDGKIVLKPAFEIIGTESIVLREAKKIHWVSRSAGKLDGFLEQTRITNHESRISNAHCLDVGSSTGGFTQVLLERGAAHVDAVDVGTDQLHSSLRDDPRVTSYEQMDIRNFVKRESGNVNRKVLSNNDLRITIYDVIVCDASFISLTEIFSSILEFADSHTSIILLWKPQFEVGAVNLNRKIGVPKDEKVVGDRQKEWEEFVIHHSCEILQKEKSTVIGEAGNVEWLYWVKKV